MENNLEDSSRSKKYLQTFNNYSDETTWEYCCSFCSYKSKNKSLMTTHIQIHSSVNSFQCEICQKCYSSASSLRIHERIHFGKKPYKCYECNFCNSSFTTVSDLKHHLRTHSGRKPYKCNICNSSFSRKQNLDFHIRTQHYNTTGHLPRGQSISINFHNGNRPPQQTTK